MCFIFTSFMLRCLFVSKINPIASENRKWENSTREEIQVDESTKTKHRGNSFGVSSVNYIAKLPPSQTNRGLCKPKQFEEFAI
jgi:hypothetical protein